MVWNKQTHCTSSWDRANYVFRICSMALWAFMPLSLLIHSIGLDISQEQPTALIPSPKTGHSEFVVCGMSIIIGVQASPPHTCAHILTCTPRSTCTTISKKIGGVRSRVFLGLWIRISGSTWISCIM